MFGKLQIFAGVAAGKTPEDEPMCVACCVEGRLFEVDNTVGYCELICTPRGVNT